MTSPELLPALRSLLTEQAVALGLLDPNHPPEAVDPAIDALLDREVVTPEPTDEECSRYYALHPDEFTSGDLVFARHILIGVTPGAPLQRVREQAERILHDVRAKPERFAELAAQYSNCPSGKEGGHLGQLGRGECVPEFEQPLFEGRSTGVVPRLINTRFGFHIVAVDQRIEGDLVPYEAVRDQIAARLYGASQDTALRQYVQILAARAGVELPGVAAATSPLVQ